MMKEEYRMSEATYQSDCCHPPCGGGDEGDAKAGTRIVKLDDAQKASRLFGDWQETLIWSCLQNVMGSVYVDRMDTPASAMAVLGDFQFFAGEPNMAFLACEINGTSREFSIMVPQNESWSRMIENHYKGAAKKITRYALKKEPDAFDIGRLRRFVASLPQEYTLKMIDIDLYDRCRNESWSNDLASQYIDYPAYRELGLGVVAMHRDAIVSGASSYASYNGGIEIEIDTKAEYRRKGLATVCGAKLILECLDRDIYPSWDAHNAGSLALAEKLGYHFDREYIAYEVRERYHNQRHQALDHVNQIQ